MGKDDRGAEKKMGYSGTLRQPDTEITTNVPKDATTGPVTVMTPNGPLTRNVAFLVP